MGRCPVFNLRRWDKMVRTYFNFWYGCNGEITFSLVDDGWNKLQDSLIVPQIAGRLDTYTFGWSMVSTWRDMGHSHLEASWKYTVGHFVTSDNLLIAMLKIELKQIRIRSTDPVTTDRAVYWKTLGSSPGVDEAFTSSLSIAWITSNSTWCNIQK